MAYWDYRNDLLNGRIKLLVKTNHSINTMKLNNFQEQELVDQLKKGNSKAVATWFNCYQQDLLSLAYQKISNQKDAQDVVQETMINSLRQIQMFREESSLKTWMVTILRHEIADFYRKKYAKKALSVIPLGKHLIDKPIQDSNQVNEEVRLVLAQMSKYKKSLLLMKYVDGLKMAEIAKKVGKTLKAVESELWRSKDTFKKIYAQVCETKTV